MLPSEDRSLDVGPMVIYFRSVSESRQERLHLVVRRNCYNLSRSEGLKCLRTSYDRHSEILTRRAIGTASVPVKFLGVLVNLLYR